MNELEAHTEAVVDVEQVKSRGSCHVTGGAWSAVELNLQRRRVNLPALADMFVVASQSWSSWDKVGQVLLALPGVAVADVGKRDDVLLAHSRCLQVVGGSWSSASQAWDEVPTLATASPCGSWSRPLARECRRGLG